MRANGVFRRHWLSLVVVALALGCTNDAVSPNRDGLLAAPGGGMNGGGGGGMGGGSTSAIPVHVGGFDGNDAISIRPIMFLALSYDHRVVDGAPANAFLHRVRELLEEAEFDL